MKKNKLFAALSAAMLGCCAMGGTAFAEETEPVDYSKYQLGDINLDGVVDVEDAQIALRLYTEYLAGRTVEESCLRNGITAEQAKLGNIVNETYSGDELVTVEDAFLILVYYNDRLCGKTGGDTITEYVQKLIQTGLFTSDVIVNER